MKKKNWVRWAKNAWLNLDSITEIREDRNTTYGFRKEDKENYFVHVTLSNGTSHSFHRGDPWCNGLVKAFFRHIGHKEAF